MASDILLVYQRPPRRDRSLIARPITGSSTQTERLAAQTTKIRVFRWKMTRTHDIHLEMIQNFFHQKSMCDPDTLKKQPWGIPRTHIFRNLKSNRPSLLCTAWQRCLDVTLCSGTSWCRLVSCNDFRQSQMTTLRSQSTPNRIESSSSLSDRVTTRNLQ